MKRGVAVGFCLLENSWLVEMRNKSTSESKAWSHTSNSRNTELAVIQSLRHKEVILFVN